MAVEVLELSHDTGAVLQCNTTGNVFGFIFESDVDTVDQFVTWVRERGLDCRTLDAEGKLRETWEEYKAAYSCAVCGAGDVTEGDNVACRNCGKFHCSQHSEDEVWSDTHNGKTTEYGHKC